MPPANQKAQKALLEKYETNVKYVSDPDEGHTMADDIPGQAF